MLDRILSVFRGVDPWDLTQAQQEATVDLMVWVMFADGHLADAEHAQIDAELEPTEWFSRRPVKDYMLQSVTRLREALGDPGREAAWMKDIAARLGDNAARRNAVLACERVSAADGQIDITESALLRDIRAALGID